MRVGTIVSLGASAVLGLGALAAARIWLPTQAPSTNAHSAAPVATGAPVVVAAADIPYGSKIEARQLTVVRLPANAAPSGVFTSVDQVMHVDSGGAPVALVAISAREPLLPVKLSGPGARPTLAAMIGDGMRAFTIGVTEVAGGGGHILPGDRVDVVLTRDLTAQQNMDGGHGTKLISDMVMQNVRVLGMDLNIDPASTHPAVAHTATLEVSVEDAERLSLAAQAGTLSLALRRTGAAEIKPVRSMVSADLGPVGGKTGAVHRRGGGGGAPAHPAGSAVIIVHGDSRTTTAVPNERFGAGA